MRNLPTGTVTFLFTDIEGSTRLLHALGTFVSAALSPDGTRLYAVSTGRRGIRLQTDPEAWKRHACLISGRKLTAREWKDALPDRPYRTVC
jgi:hypothetical protein